MTLQVAPPHEVLHPKPQRDSLAATSLGASITLAAAEYLH